MRRACRSLAVSLLMASLVWAQEPSPASGGDSVAQFGAQAVPRLIKFSGTLLDGEGKPRSGTAGLTFALYKEQQGGTPLWVETQNVTLDAQGHYTVLLGASKAEGLPLDLFAGNEARWLAVQVENQAEQGRVLLVSVPYALKAADAETLGGRPASAFLAADSLAAGQSSGAGKARSPQRLKLSSAGVQPVSYTHLTLPTICSV